MHKYQRLNNAKLYAITKETDSNSVKLACKAGIHILQFREWPNLQSKSDKQKLEIIRDFRQIAEDYGVLFIVNNRIDLAILAKADGVHLGQNDFEINDARNLTDLYDKNFIIGKSTHSLEQAILAEKQGANYLGIGPIITTPTKPTYTPIGLQIALQVQQIIKIPAFSIGGINSSNIRELAKFGLNRFAIVRDIFETNNIAKKVKDLLNKSS